MSGGGAWFANFGQISFGVPDLHEAIAFWQGRMGVGPWSVFYGLTFAADYEGRRVAFPFDVAIGWHDGRVVELIHVAGDGPSPLHDALNRPIIGLQRLASVTDDIARDAQIATANGLELYASGEAGGQRFLYFRSVAAPGVILELLERTESFAALCADLEARAATFAGRPAGGAPAAAAPIAPVPATMPAAEIDGYGATDGFAIREVPVPVPGEGEVRIRVAAASVNPVDAKLRRGALKHWLPLRFPARLGGDAAGIVDAVGPGVSGFAPGDRVAAQVGPDRAGSYAAWLVAPAATTVHVPDGMDLAAAAALPTGALTGIQLIETGIRPRAGTRVLVTGGGGSVGRAAILAALDAGAEVFAGVRGAGGDAVADLAVAGVIDLADRQALAAAAPFDAVADTVGGSVAEALFAVLAPDGILASVAMPAPVPPRGASQRFCSLITRFDGPRLERHMRALVATRTAVPIAHRLPLADAGRAHALIEAGGVGGKIVLEP